MTNAATAPQVQSEAVADAIGLLDKLRNEVRRYARRQTRIEGATPYDAEEAEEIIDEIVGLFETRDEPSLQEALETLEELEADLQLGAGDLIISLDDCVTRLAVTEVETVYNIQHDEILLPRLILPISQALLERIQKNPAYLYQLSPRQFEEFVAELFFRHGFQVELTKQTRDGGKDIIAVSSRLDIPIKYIVECKRYAYERKVSLEYVQRLLGVKVAEDANKAILVTTSQFTRDAVAFAHRHFWDLALKDFSDLSAWVRNTKP